MYFVYILGPSITLLQLGAETPRKRGAGYFGYRWGGMIYRMLVLFKIYAN